VLGRPEDDSDVVAARAAIADGPIVRALRADLVPEQPYHKWNGAYWRLISLADLHLPPGDERVEHVAEAVVSWSMAFRPQWMDGRARRCASQQGFVLGVCCRLGVPDPRLAELAARLAEWQWPDGGWNCDKRPDVRRSSFHETISPLWGLGEYRRATGDRRLDPVIERAADVFLRRRLFRSTATGEVMHPQFLRFRYPPYWHYDVLFGLRVLADLGLIDDPRAADALDLVESKRRRDGRWNANGRWWRAVGGPTYPEAVDWGPSAPSEMVTLHALRALRAAGRRP
jgi:hypothetical protein